MVQISDANKPLISRGTFAREQSTAWKVVLETLNINIGIGWHEKSNSWKVVLETLNTITNISGVNE